MTSSIKNRRSPERRMKHFLEGMASIFDLTGGHLEPKSAADYLADAEAMVKNAQLEVYQQNPPFWEKLAEEYGIPSQRKRVKIFYRHDGNKLVLKSIDVEPVE